ncbi:glycosyltransferase family 2 protein [Dyella monticola]|uniref:Glycosyltransferase family 2 protein n=1 Tax=Dyella monticola TaxID=1927958 RepID=A0A370WUS2_9GAMM|nr:glycosyltransferase family 2 protein [Dyella monticola]RDS79872.1 glycosyltransferase family 2 protein [Dyella monticola]
MHETITAPSELNKSNDNGAAIKRAAVSVVVPCFRCMKTIDAAIASVANQTLPPAEVLLIEDGSGDGTLDALHRIAATYKSGWIKVIAMPDNGGPSRARNTGWGHAKQPYIAFLDSDDRWAPRKLELQMAALDADPTIALIAHKMLVRPRNTPFSELQEPIQTEIIGRGRLLFHNPFPTTSVMVRRDLPFRFDENIWYSEDYFLWSQIRFAGHRCAKVNQVLALWTKRIEGERGLSDNVLAVHNARRIMRRRLMQEGFISPPEYLFSLAVGVLSRLRRKLNMAMHPERYAAYRSQPG